LKRAFGALVLTGLTHLAFADEIPVGFQSSTLQDSHNGRSLESANLAKRLSRASSRYVELSDVSHFTFLQVCKPGAQAMLEEDVPSDGIICQDGKNARPRGELQQQIASLIAEFLQTSDR